MPAWTLTLRGSFRRGEQGEDLRIGEGIRVGRLRHRGSEQDPPHRNLELLARQRPRYSRHLVDLVWHVPDAIHQVPGVPRTLSGKKLEVPVRRILLGTPVAEAADPDALANPEVLALFAPPAPPA